MGVSLNHPFLDGIFHEINHPASLGYPHVWNPPYQQSPGCNHDWPRLRKHPSKKMTGLMQLSSSPSLGYEDIVPTYSSYLVGGFNHLEKY